MLVLEWVASLKVCCYRDLNVLIYWRDVVKWSKSRGKNYKNIEISESFIAAHCKISSIYAIFIVSLLICCSPSHKYDIIWFQWVCENVTDEDLTKILKRYVYLAVFPAVATLIPRFKKALTPTGTIILKENVTRGCSGFYLDYEDNTITRTREQYIEIFTDAKLNIFKTKEVTDSFEKGLFPIMIWAMR